MRKLLFALAVLPTLLFAEVAHRSGVVHTPEVDLGYETSPGQVWSITCE